MKIRIKLILSILCLLGGVAISAPFIVSCNNDNKTQILEPPLCSNLYVELNVILGIKDNEKISFEIFDGEVKQESGSFEFDMENMLSFESHIKHIYKKQIMVVFEYNKQIYSKCFNLL